MSEPTNFKDFLKKYKLSKYYEAFQKLGLSSLEIAINLSDSDLNYIFDDENKIFDKVLFRNAVANHTKEKVYNITLIKYMFKNRGIFRRKL